MSHAGQAALPERGARRHRELLASLEARLSLLPDKPQETAEATLIALWHAAHGSPMSAEAAAEQAFVPELAPEGELRLNALIAERLAGVPLAHLTGRQRFMGLEMLAGPAALIPRHETELLGAAAMELLALRGQPGSSGAMPAPVVVDVCTGSGNLALAVAHHAPQARVHASDLSADAVELARRNASHLGLGSRVDFRVGDLLAPFDEPAFHGAVDLLLCNPPYISSGKVGEMHPEISGFEPRLAFDGGPLGVRILQRLIREAPRFLAPEGWLAFEVGEGQGPAVMRRLEASGAFGQRRSLCDARGVVRAILAAQ